MHIRDKKDVLATIVTRSHKRCVNGALKTYPEFQAYLGISEGGRKLRLGATSIEELKKKVDAYYAASRTASVGIFELKPGEVYDCKTALSMLRDKSITITLTELARRFLDTMVDTVNPTPMSVAFAEYLEGIPEIQDHQRKAVVSRVKKMCMTIGWDRNCSDVTAKEVHAYFKELDTESAKTRNNHASYCKTFFEWCAKKARRYVTENPMSDFEYQKVIHERPDYMKHEDVSTLFVALEEYGRKDLIAIATLSFFCGIRTDEIERLAKTPEDVRVSEGSIIMAKPKGYTQGRGQRVINMTPNAVAWIAVGSVDGMMEKYSSIAQAQRAIFRIGDKAGLSLCVNAGRHSFITHHSAAVGDPGKTAAQCGTSLKMVRDHYNGLETKANGEAYFNIMPKSIHIV